MTGVDIAAMTEWLGEARWFGGKGRTWKVSAVSRVGVLPGGAELDASIDLVEVTYTDDEGGRDLYQVPLAYHPEPQERLAHALVGRWDDADFGPRHVYDAVHDRDAMALWLEAFARAGDSPDGLVFHRLPGHELDLESHSSLFSGEQSNSSVAFGEDALMKVFRKVTPGINPDISVHRVLTEAGSEHIAALYGWLEVADASGEPLQLAMLQQFLRTASDGWELALASVRNLFSEADLHAEEVGGDFAGEAARLGVALAEVHLALEQHFPIDSSHAPTHPELAAAMLARLDRALAVTDSLREHEPALRAVFDRVRDLDGDLAVQQVHGDLHLGQTLRTSLGWKIVDFEGEPAKPLAERTRPDSPWRDVAGMLRSFEYAPRVVALTGFGDDHGDEAHQQAYRAGEWAARNGAAFLDAYSDTRPLSEADQVLLDAYVVDKAVYETVYEARNRPGWISIPLSALEAFLDSRGGGQ